MDVTSNKSSIRTRKIDTFARRVYPFTHTHIILIEHKNLTHNHSNGVLAFLLLSSFLFLSLSLPSFLPIFLYKYGCIAYQLRFIDWDGQPISVHVYLLFSICCQAIFNFDCCSLSFCLQIKSASAQYSNHSGRRAAEALQAWLLLDAP